MREALKNISGKRIKVFAEVGNFGTKKAFKGAPIPTVCLINVKGETGNEICDHLWLTMRKQLSSLGLKVGDRICFEARSKPYIKGYKGRREVFDRPVTQDYTLSNPTKFKKVNWQKEISTPEPELFT